MKQKFKKYLYLINDLSALFLRKDNLQAEEDIKKMRKVLRFIVFLFIVSVVINIYFIIKSIYG